MRENRDKCEIEDLRFSAKRVGRLYPVLLDKEGNIIDGNHRISADGNWPAISLPQVKTEKDRLLARLISNVCRRSVSSGEKKEILGRLGEIYVEEGVHLGKIASKIADETGMSYRWAMKYLPDKYKERPGLGGPAKMSEFDMTEEKNKKHHHLAQFSNIDFSFLLLDTNQKTAIVRKYINTEFVNITLQKQFFLKIEKIANRFNVLPEVIINNALHLALKQLENIEIAAAM